MSSDETLYLLAATHAELEPYKNIPDPRLMQTTFHQSKGLESDHVILIGAQPFFGWNNLKNQLYLLASFPQSFDKAQEDEVLRLAYVATTRAKKMCIWFAARKSGNAIDQVPANDKPGAPCQVATLAPTFVIVFQGTNRTPTTPLPIPSFHRK